VSNFSDNPISVRVDFFEPSGKWYETEAVVFTGYDDNDILAAFKNSLKAHLGNRMRGMTAVCLHPYHKNEHPVMLRIPESGL